MGNVFYFYFSKYYNYCLNRRPDGEKRVCNVAVVYRDIRMWPRQNRRRTGRSKIKYELKNYRDIVEFTIIDKSISRNVLISFILRRRCQGRVRCRLQIRRNVRTRVFRGAAHPNIDTRTIIAFVWTMILPVGRRSKTTTLRAARGNGRFGILCTRVRVIQRDRSAWPYYYIILLCTRYVVEKKVKQIVVVRT